MSTRVWETALAPSGGVQESQVLRLLFVSEDRMDWCSVCKDEEAVVVKRVLSVKQRYTLTQGHYKKAMDTSAEMSFL